jgi:hypothetical protein
VLVSVPACETRGPFLSAHRFAGEKRLRFSWFVPSSLVLAQEFIERKLPLNQSNGAMFPKLHKMGGSFKLLTVCFHVQYMGRPGETDSNSLYSVMSPEFQML